MSWTKNIIPTVIKVIIASCLWATVLPAQCPDGRLIQTVYAFERDTVTYGSNTNYLGDSLELEMDIYYPVSDTFTKRPVVIWAFGGAFVSGERNDGLMNALCENYAQKGYVAATIDYRLFPNEQLGNPDSLELIDANIKAVGDMKAAIRYFRQSVDEGNPYRIDPGFIVVGGYSAGAFTALHLSYLNEGDDMPPYIQSIIELNGGINGNTGDSINRSYSSDVNACISFAGALFDTTLLDGHEVPLFALHGTEDQVVPIGLGRSVRTVTTYGSQLMAERAGNVGLEHIYYPVMGADHIGIWFLLNDINAFISASDSVLHDMYCDRITSLEMRPQLRKFTLHPNPADQFLNLNYDASIVMDKAAYKIIDVSGRIVADGILNTNDQKINISGLQEGLYWFQISGFETKSFVVKH